MRALASDSGCAHRQHGFTPSRRLALVRACACRRFVSGGLLIGCWTISCGAADYTGGDKEPEQECADIVLNGGGGIDAPPDGAALCPEGMCNYQTSDGCSAAAGCLPGINADDSVSPTCVAAGGGLAGDSCSPWANPSDCAPGYFCADGACRQLCCGTDWSACVGETSCFRPLLIRLGSSDDPVDVPVNVGLCFPTGTCHVLESDSCDEEPGKTCKIVDPTGAQACVPSGPGGVGDICEVADYCGPGLSCVGHICRRLCRAEACGEPACPPDVGACVHFDRDPEGVGECTPNFLVE